MYGSFPAVGGQRVSRPGRSGRLDVDSSLSYIVDC